MAWWFAVVESRHELQNPTSADKIRELGRRLRLGPSSRVLDLAAGRGGPALVLASEFGCHITSVERAPEFAAAARERIAAAGLDDRIEYVEADALEFLVEPGTYDAALCLGASFIWGGLQPAVAHLAAAVRPGGLIAVGEPFWRTWPLPAAFELDPGDEDFVTLTETVARFETAGAAVVAMIASDQDDWDRYESLHWQALDDWLRANPGDPDAVAFRERGRRNRERYLRWERDLFGWAIFVARP